MRTKIEADTVGAVIVEFLIEPINSTERSDRHTRDRCI
jgi:hypothetical protein